ncbi:cytochrome P450, partial [Clohesyomyces aquaticus]
WTDRLMFDIMGDLAFGRSFEIKEPGPNPVKEISYHIVNYVRFFYPVSAYITRSPFMEFVSWSEPRVLSYLFDLITPKEVKPYYQFIHDSVSCRVEVEKNNKSSREPRLDIFHFWCNARHPGTGELAYTEKALRAEALLLIVAGSYSLATATSGFWFYMSRNPRACSKLTKEIRSAFSSSEDIFSGSKLGSCSYLYACIDETLRLTPPTPSELGLETFLGRASINGEYFQQGVVVGCSGYSLGRSENTFCDPGKFRPERYIPSEKTRVTVDEVKRLKVGYHPFLIGPTNCAGISRMDGRIQIRVKGIIGTEGMRRGPGHDALWCGMI